MTTFKKFVMCFGLIAVFAMPLAGCSGTWHGVKEDWHDMTGSNDSGKDEMRTASQSDAPAQDSGVIVNDNGPSAYN